MPRVALHTTFAASRKEPLIAMMDRVRQAFLDAALPAPELRFTFTDSYMPNAVSIVSRALKRYPGMEQFLEVTKAAPPRAAVRYLSNAATGVQAEESAIRAIAGGIPQSFPFFGVGLHFHGPAFGEAFRGPLPKIGNSLPGVLITDNWWVSGRQRSLSVYTVVEADETSGKLPPHPGPVAAVIGAFGKPKRTEELPVFASGGVAPSIPAANLEAVKAVITDYRARIFEVVERAGLPHRLPPAVELRSLQNAGVAAGPRKPALKKAFEPLGYQFGSARGSGQFHLIRRTPGSLTIGLSLDVGTWSREVSAFFQVRGAGFKVSLAIPVTPTEIGTGQYPIGDAAQWQRIVENLAAMVRELDRSFVPDIERAAGPSPEGYRPPPM